VLENSKKLAVGVVLGFWIALLVLVPTCSATHTGKTGFDQISGLIGKKDAIMVAGPNGHILFAKNEKKKLVPASILKLFSSLVAMHYLGPRHRFSTEFYIDTDSNLKIKGYGDPLLVSEIVSEISRKLVTKLNGNENLNDLVLDNSYFDKPLTIPGITSSSEPYDAPNGALCVNFNTVNFKRSGNSYVSAEPQSPLLPVAIKKIKNSGLKNGRIVFSHENHEITFYAGALFQYFIKENGINFYGTLGLGRVNKYMDRLIFRYDSRYSLQQIISKLLEYSNNFTTNQLLITSGIKAFGAPGTLNKGVSAALAYAVDVLKVEGMTIYEGSGISRRNRVTAEHMLTVLEAFEPYRYLMRRQKNEYYKTGTLRGISTRAGYIIDNTGKPYRYVVMINTPGKTTGPVMKKLMHILN
jgi:D-alanyl-D-alanine carboxypeptidase/D-alanyl-D-alanine-endopeptidase (penicillin-binding protein 4)